MKRLKILTILMAAALGLSVGLAYAQFTGGPGGGWSLGESSPALLNNVAADTNVKIIRAGQAISNIAEGTNVVNVTLSSTYPNNNLKVGQKIVISGTTNYDGAFTITAVTDQSNFSYAQASASRAVETSGTAGGHYTSLSGWEAGVQGTLTAVQSAECYNDWASGLSDNLTISGSTATSAYYMKITVPVSERNIGTAGTGFKIAGTVTIGDSYAALEDIEVTGLVTISSPAVVTTGGNVLFTGGLAVASGAALNADTSNMAIAGDFSPAGTVNAQSSSITFTGATVDFTTGTFDPGLASLTFSGVSLWKHQVPAGKKYNNLRFGIGTATTTMTIIGSPDINNKLVLDTGSGGAINSNDTIFLYGDLVCNSGSGGTALINMAGVNKYAHISGPATGQGGTLLPIYINKGNSRVIIAGTLTFQDLTLVERYLEFKAGYTYTIIAGKTMKLEVIGGDRTIVFRGTSMSNMVRLRSSIPGTRWNLVVGSTYVAQIVPIYTDVQDCNASNTINASASANVNSGNNVNWNFGATSGDHNVTWIADTAKNWSDTTAWSTGVLPTGSACVFFTNSHNGNCTLAANVSVSSITSNGYTGTLDTSVGNWNINTTGWNPRAGGLYWHSGILKANGSTITIRRVLNLRGGTFTHDTSTLEFNSANWYDAGVESDIPNFNIFNVYTGFYIKSGATITVGLGKQLNFIGNNLPPNEVTSGSGRGLVGLRSLPEGIQWYIDNSAGGTVTASYVDVEDSNVITGGNDAQKVTATSSINFANNINWIFDSLPLPRGTVTLESYVAGATGKVTAAFNIQSSTLPADCTIDITFPSEFPSPVSSGAVEVLPGSLDGALSASVSGRTVTITRTGGTAVTGTYYAPATLTIVVGNITNPPSAGTTGTYSITTKTYPAGATIHYGPGFTGSTIVANPLSGLTCSNGTTGTAQTIGWTSSATSKPASVNIKYSTDSGVTYPNLIAKVTNNTGSNSYSWKPLSVLGPNVRIKVEDSANSQVFVASASDIAIAAPAMTITSPVAGDEWATDAWHTVTWTPDSTTNPAITRVKLEYSYNGGTTWFTRHDSLPNIGSYDWNMIDILPSPTMKFRVTGLPAVTGITYGGTAAGKVATPSAGGRGAWLESGNKVLVIDIATDFALNNALTLTGLRFSNFSSAASIGQLGLDIDYDGVMDATDSKYIRINDNSVYSGGYGDGWSYAGCTN